MVFTCTGSKLVSLAEFNLIVLTISLQCNIHVQSVGGVGALMLLRLLLLHSHIPDVLAVICQYIQTIGDKRTNITVNDQRQDKKSLVPLKWTYNPASVVDPTDNKLPERFSKYSTSLNISFVSFSSKNVVVFILPMPLTSSCNISPIMFT